VSPAASPVAASTRRKLVRPAVFAVVLLVAALVLWPKVPRAQQLRMHLGVGSSHVVAATARIGRDGTWDRQATWRFDHGAPSSSGVGGAPPVIDWAFDLPNGPADVEVELQSTTSSDLRAVHVDLRGGESDVELTEMTRGLE